jgi:hypothetical protein
MAQRIHSENWIGHGAPTKYIIRIESFIDMRRVCRTLGGFQGCGFWRVGSPHTAKGFPKSETRDWKFEIRSWKLETQKKKDGEVNSPLQRISPERSKPMRSWHGCPGAADGTSFVRGLKRPDDLRTVPLQEQEPV